MYMGEHTNVTEKLHEIQNKGRTKSSPLDHIALPLTFFFMVTDLMTVHLYTESLFDERPEMGHAGGCLHRPAARCLPHAGRQTQGPAGRHAAP